MPHDAYHHNNSHPLSPTSSSIHASPADADASRPSLEVLLERYFELLPEYQGVPLDRLRLKRVLFGAFPCYQDSPLLPAFDRVLQVRHGFGVVVLVTQRVLSRLL